MTDWVPGIDCSQTKPQSSVFSTSSRCVGCVCVVCVVCVKVSSDMWANTVTDCAMVPERRQAVWNFFPEKNTSFLHVVNAISKYIKMDQKSKWIPIDLDSKWMFHSRI